MARSDLGGVANRLFDGFLAPLVIGGEVVPGRPIGSKAALSLGRERVVADSDRFATVQIARTRVARRLAPIDRVPGPTEAEWALGAVLHDLVQAAHPGFDSAFRRSAPGRILDLAEATLTHVPSPATVGEAVARHTWFARVFEMRRTDTVVKWWVGHRTFLGETPPARLTAWPEIRRVQVEKTARAVTDLPAAGSAVDVARFVEELAHFLRKTPLTDVATCHRSEPVFTWGPEALGLAATGPGRALLVRALRVAPKADADAALGRATRKLIASRVWPAVSVALDLLAERSLMEAESAQGVGETSPAIRDPSDDGTYARCVGAIAACVRLRAADSGLAEAERLELLARLEPIAASHVARAILGDLAAQEPAARV